MGPTGDLTIFSRFELDKTDGSCMIKIKAIFDCSKVIHFGEVLVLACNGLTNFEQHWVRNNTTGTNLIFVYFILNVSIKNFQLTNITEENFKLNYFDLMLKINANKDWFLEASE